MRETDRGCSRPAVRPVRRHVHGPALIEPCEDLSLHCGVHAQPAAIEASSRENIFLLCGNAIRDSREASRPVAQRLHWGVPGGQSHRVNRQPAEGGMLATLYGSSVIRGCRTLRAEGLVRRTGSGNPHGRGANCRDRPEKPSTRTPYQTQGAHHVLEGGG